MKSAKGQHPKLASPLSGSFTCTIAIHPYVTVLTIQVRVQLTSERLQFTKHTSIQLVTSVSPARLGKPVLVGRLLFVMLFCVMRTRELRTTYVLPVLLVKQTLQTMMHRVSTPSVMLHYALKARRLSTTRAQAALMVNSKLKVTTLRVMTPLVTQYFAVQTRKCSRMHVSHAMMDISVQPEMMLHRVIQSALLRLSSLPTKANYKLRLQCVKKRVLL